MLKKVRLILPCVLFLVCLSFPLCATLRVVGRIPSNYQLLGTLTSYPVSALEGYHSSWIKQLEHILMDKKSLDEEDLQLLSHFDKNDVQTIIRPIFSRNNVINNEKIEIFFSERVAFECDQQHTDTHYLIQPETLSCLYAASKEIISLVNTGTLVFLGQTPAYIGYMVECLIKARALPGLSVLFIPYSGRPDTIIPRLNNGRKWHWTRESYKEIVTRSRELFFRQILIKKGFNPTKFKDGENIYIVDNSRGPSLASFLMLICRWYEELNIPLANFNYIAMDSKNGCLDLTMSSDLRFEIDTWYLEMDPVILNVHLDQVYDNVRVQPPCSAYMWRSEFWTFSNQYPRPEAQQLLLLYANYIKNCINTEKNSKLTIERCKCSSI